MIFVELVIILYITGLADVEDAVLGRGDDTPSPPTKSFPTKSP